MNLYEYCGNNPLNEIDYLGLCSQNSNGSLLGTTLGQEAAQYWANQSATSNNPLEQSFDNTMGSLATLWTPDTYQQTISTLGAAYGSQGVLESTGTGGNLDYYRYSNGTNSTAGPWLTTNNYGEDFSTAQQQLQLPTTPTQVNQVNVPFYEPVAGPRTVSGNPDLGTGGGTEYYRSWLFPPNP